MANLQVGDVNVPSVIKRLKSSEWLTPMFQRDFVWSNAAVIALVNSIIDARPIGMIIRAGNQTLSVPYSQVEQYFALTKHYI